MRSVSSRGDLFIEFYVKAHRSWRLDRRLVGDQAGGTPARGGKAPVQRGSGPSRGPRRSLDRCVASSSPVDSEEILGVGEVVVDLSFVGVV